jgi:hypothetical protein
MIIVIVFLKVPLKNSIIVKIIDSSSGTACDEYFKRDIEPIQIIIESINITI